MALINEATITMFLVKMALDTTGEFQNYQGNEAAYLGNVTQMAQGDRNILASKNPQAINARMAQEQHAPPLISPQIVCLNVATY